MLQKALYGYINAIRVKPPLSHPILISGLFFKLILIHIAAILLHPVASRSVFT
jgi:hypothetical protein